MTIGRQRFGVILALLVSAGITTSCCLLLYQCILKRPLNLPDSEALVFLHGAAHEPGMDWPEGWNNKAFTALSAFDVVPLPATSGYREWRTVQACLVDHSFFPVLGVHAELGRVLSETDMARGSPPVAVVSHSFWTSRFGSNTDLNALLFTMAGVQYRVVGVLPAGLEFPGGTDVYSARNDDTQSLIASAPGLTGSIIGRLRPGVSLTEAREREKALVKHLHEVNKDRHYHPTDTVGITLARSELVREVESHIVLLAVAGCSVAVVVLATLVLLSSLRAAERRKVMAIQAAVGATAGHIARSEAFWWLRIGVVASLLATVGTVLLIELIKRVGAGLVPRLNELRADTSFGGWLVGAILVLVLLLSLLHIPQRTGERHLTSLLNQGGTQGVVRLKARTRQAITIAQLALALALTAVAVSASRHYSSLASRPAGFDPTGVYIAHGFVASPPGRDDAPSPDTSRGPASATENPRAPGDRRAAITQEIVAAAESLRSRPDVVGAAVLDPAPFRLTRGQYARTGQDKSEIFVPMFHVAGNIPLILGLPVRMGRWFDEGDERARSTQVAVINEFMAKTQYGGDPLGKLLWLPANSPAANVGDMYPRTIVGVVGDTLLEYAQQELYPVAYLPLDAEYHMTPAYDVAVKMSGRVPPPRLGQSGRLVQFGDWSSLAATMEQAGVTDRISAYITNWFAVCSLLLALTSVYAVSWTIARQRQQELFLRICLGASPTMLGLRLLTSSLGLVTIASVGAFLLTKGLERFLSSKIFGFPVFSWSSFGISVAILLFAALLATLRPARSIWRLDPSALLRAS